MVKRADREVYILVVQTLLLEGSQNRKCKNHYTVDAIANDKKSSEEQVLMLQQSVGHHHLIQLIAKSAVAALYR